MNILRHPLLVWSMVTLATARACADDAIKGAPAGSNGHKVQAKVQGPTSDGSLRIPRPTADVNGAQSPRLGDSVSASDIAKLDVKSPDRLNIPVMTVKDVQQNSREGLGLLGMYALCPDDASPCYITNVFPTSELNQFGIESGDLLTKLNGVSPFDYMHSTHPIKPGASVNLTVNKHGIPKTLSVTLLDIRMFTPFFKSYSQWATSHISFLQGHQGQYHSCGLF
ncbi:hypothetical protein BH10CYA1_BH10CYA1_63130 [soil metagenome]